MLLRRFTHMHVDVVENEVVQLQGLHLSCHNNISTQLHIPSSHFF